MGGRGSGGGGVYNKKRLTRECFRLPLKLIRKSFSGSLICGESSVGYMKNWKEVTISYESKGKSYSHKIGLEYTPCNYGGERAWFVCPECYERVSVLYLIPGRAACRICLNLNYPCQQEGWLDRQIRKQWKLKDKLENERWRPRYMHHKTYWRIERKIDRLEGAICGGMMNLPFMKAHKEQFLTWKEQEGKQAG